MRLTVLIAVSLLIAGCSHATVTEPEQTPATGATTSTSVAPSAATRPPAPTSSRAAAAAVPADGAPIAEVITWIEAGRHADAAGYHSATHDGETTDLGDDIAFSVPGESRRTTICMTDSDRQAGALACLVDLVKPPARPEAVYGQWKGGWVDFNGSTLQVGSAHGDPGPFRAGQGPELSAGLTLSFGDFRCRAEGAALFCVNYAHRAAVRFSPAGIGTFGCLHPVPPPEGVGQLFGC